MSDWRETKRDFNRGGRLVIVWWLIAIVLVLSAGAGIWGLTVATSGVRGFGDGVVERNSADNWLAAQGRFEDNFAEYEATLVRIDVAYVASTASPDDRTLEQTYLGTVTYCTSVVADYNADARNYLSEDFLAADLPSQIDPATCNTKGNQ